MTENWHPLSTCAIKHTMLNPTEEQFCCPKCGAKCGDFCVDEAANWDCPALHMDDVLSCYQCGYSTTGRAFAKRLIAKANVETCPTCMGCGTVKRSAKSGGPRRPSGKKT